MTNEFAIKVLTELKGYGDKFANIGYDRKEALDLAIRALEQQQDNVIHNHPCEDCISREEVVKLLEKEDWADTVYGVLALPSVTPQSKVGEWIDEGQYAEGHSHHAYCCSVCGNHIIEIMPDDFCKFCGAKMGGNND